MRNLTTLVKASRKDAFQLVLMLREGKMLSPKQEDQLLNFFAPAPPRIAKTAFEWVAAACGVDNVRAYLNVVHITNGEMTGCDGLRLHWATAALPDGEYDPKTGLKLKVSQGKCPNLNSLKRIEGFDSEPEDRVRFSECEILPPAGQGHPPLIQAGETCKVNSKYLLAGLNSKTLQGSGSVKEDRLFGSIEFGNYLIMGAI